MLRDIDVAIIGAGPAGIAAGVGARRAGAENVVVFERDWDLGGILQQCIHPGFGLHTFKEELTGPEYVHRYLERAHEAGVTFVTNTMVFHMEEDGSFWTMNPERGIEHVRPKATVLAMGCRERPLGALGVPGSRPAGIYTAGTAQRFVNMEGYMPGKRVVVLGSGDIGLIMVRRMLLEGAKVEAVFELMSWPGGLRRNIAQCLDDYGVPLYLDHTVTKVHGKDRLEAVTVAQVDQYKSPIPGTERTIECDTLLLAVGLIPENELSRMAGVEIHPLTGGPKVNQFLQTSKPNVFAAGNVVVVYDLVDWVSAEGLRAGENAARYALGTLSSPGRTFQVEPGRGVRLLSPQVVGDQEDSMVFLRVSEPVERRCRIVTMPDVGSANLRYARPGEMNELKIKAEALRSLGDDVKAIQVHVEEVR
ncbi:NAD(P)/FAD-dependent oxidoreductase [Thermanaerovibrio acidaminovorans]|jgi:NADPH-dependent 2,4-dienoyl-CoA reductase/sulfur reductase-like enzyme|uniref:NAD(P)/FAD-dependent oxidoreductase n=1 Tax=Thermanaerovibrio acidaminovorans TaxID=81462 RepID=UPI00249042A3|nr:FAD-dependent oxidoreductase [Thermanaerovibrio acidaminovorans]